MFPDIVGAPTILWGLVNQSGVAIPTMTILPSPYPPIQPSALPGSFAYVGPGIYSYSLAGAFPAGRTVARINGGDDGANIVGYCSCVRTSSTIVRIMTVDLTGTPADSILTNAFFEIIVMPR